jgi:hypothetical protein
MSTIQDKKTVEIALIVQKAGQSCCPQEHNYLALRVLTKEAKLHYSKDIQLDCACPCHDKVTDEIMLSTVAPSTANVQ